MVIPRFYVTDVCLNSARACSLSKLFCNHFPAILSLTQNKKNSNSKVNMDGLNQGIHVTGVQLAKYLKRSMPK